MSLGAESTTKRLTIDEAVERVEGLIKHLDEISTLKSQLLPALDGSPPEFSGEFCLWLTSMLDNRVAEIHHTIKVLMEPLREPQR